MIKLITVDYTLRRQQNVDKRQYCNCLALEEKLLIVYLG